MKIVPCCHSRHKKHRNHRNHNRRREAELEFELLKFYSSHPLTYPINLNFIDQPKQLWSSPGFSRFHHQSPQFHHQSPQFHHQSPQFHHQSPQFHHQSPQFHHQSPKRNCEILRLHHQSGFKPKKIPSTTYLSVISTSILSLPAQFIRFNTIKDAIRSNVSFDRTQCIVFPKKCGMYRCSLVVSLASPRRGLSCPATIYLIKNSQTRVGKIRVSQGSAKFKRFGVELKTGDTLSCLRRPKDVQAEILNLQLTVRASRNEKD